LHPTWILDFSCCLQLVMLSGRPAKCIMAASPARIERQKPQTASHDVRVGYKADRKAACFHARCTDDRVCTEIAVVAHVQGALCIDAFSGEDPPSAERPPSTALPMPARLLRRCYNTWHASFWVGPATEIATTFLV
jgi:hypothetical protein